MASSGMEFITFLNSSMASSASTYAKSKAGQRDEIQKELNKTDRQILSLQRLLRSPSSRSGRVALGSLTQLLTSQIKEGRSLKDDILREREAVEVALDKLKITNNALYAKANKVLKVMNFVNMDDAFKNVQEGRASVFVGGLTHQLRTLDDESRVIAYALIAQKVRASGAPQKDAIIAEIDRATAAFLNATYPTDDFTNDLGPGEWVGLKVPLMKEKIKDQIRASPDLQKQYLKKSITTTKPNDAFVEELRGLIRGEVLGGGVSGSASAAAAIQVADVNAPLREKQASLDRIAGGTLVVDEAGAITIKIGATEEQTANAEKVLTAIPGQTYQGFSEEVRRMKAQPGRTDSYLESLKSELANLKTRRDAQVSALSKSPRLSTGKMALLDHPILRVAGFREAPPMRLLKWAGRPEQPAVAAAAPAAPVAAAGDETMPEFERTGSPGVYVIPGIVRKLEDKWAKLSDAESGSPAEDAAFNELKNTVDAIADFPEDVKSKLGSGYTDIQALVNEERKGRSYSKDDAPEFETSMAKLRNIDPALAEDVGTVSDLLVGLGVDSEALDTVSTSNVLVFLNDESVLGEGYEVDPNEDTLSLQTLGKSGDLFLRALGGEGPEDTETAIEQAAIAFKAPLNEDSRYGTYDFTFEGRPGIAAPPAEKAAGATVDDGGEKIGDAAVARAGGIQEDYSIPGLTAGTVPPPTPAVETTTTGKEKAFAELDAGTEWMEGEGLTRWTGKGTPWAESTPPTTAAEPALTPEDDAAIESFDLGTGRAYEDTPPPTPTAEPPAPPASEAEDPTRKEFADLIAKDSLTDKEYGQASDLVDSSPYGEQQALGEELKAKHPRGAQVEPPATTEVDETLTEAFRQPAPPPPPTTPPVPTAASPDLQFKERPSVDTPRGFPGPAPTAASPEDEPATPGILPKDHPDSDPRFVGGSREYEEHARQKITKEADQRHEVEVAKREAAAKQKAANEPGVVSDAIEMASDIRGWLGSLLAGTVPADEPVVKVEPAVKVEPSAADVTFQTESSDIRVDFEPLDLQRRQVEAAKIIISKFNAAGLSDEMVKAAIINALAESRMDTFLPAGKKGEKSYGLWHFNQATTGAGYGIEREDLEDPYWMTDKFIEVLGETEGRPETDDVEQLSSWITLNIENPGDAENQAKTRPGRYGPPADKIIEEARAELALETTPEA